MTQKINIWQTDNTNKYVQIKSIQISTTKIILGIRTHQISLFRRFTDTNVDVYGTGSVELWKTRHKISVDIRVFFVVAMEIRMALSIITTVMKCTPVANRWRISNTQFTDKSAKAGIPRRRHRHRHGLPREKIVRNGRKDV